MRASDISARGQRAVTRPVGQRPLPRQELAFPAAPGGPDRGINRLETVPAISASIATQPIVVRRIRSDHPNETAGEDRPPNPDPAGARPQSCNPQPTRSPIGRDADPLITIQVMHLNAPQQILSPGFTILSFIDQADTECWLP